jgi:transposase-like protein
MARGRPFKCPYCGSQNTTRKGVRHTSTQGIRRIRYCTNCKRKFTPKNQKPIEQQIGEQQEEHIEEQSTEQSTEQTMEQ